MVKLTGEKIILRTLKESDYLSIHKNVNDRAIARYTLRISYPNTKKHSKEFIKETRKNLRKKTAYELGIQLKENSDIIGIMSLMNVNWQDKNAEIGYWIGKKFWRKGIAFEALNLILEFGFKKLKLKRIFAGVLHPNKKSANLLKKAGFKFEGRLKKTRYKDKKWFDELMYAMLKEEFTTK